MNKKQKNILYVVVALAVCVVICVYPLLTNPTSEFSGADGAADEVIISIEEGYTPWFEPLWSPPGGETESLLFCLQAALGSGIFFYCIGYFVAAKKYKKEK